MTAKLIITWTAPSETNAIDSIVLYKKKDATNCEETLTGELIYETSDFTTQGSRYIDDGVLGGEWRYAAFSKNPGGLSPCATDTYTVILGAAPTINSYLQDITAWDSSQDMTVDLSSVFVNADGDPITKTAISSDSGIVSVTVNGDNLVLSFTGGQSGTATITVTGESNGQTVSDQFTVVVTADGDSDGDGEPDSQDLYDTQPQSISFSAIADRQVIDGNLVLSATATSELTVTYSSTSPYVTFNGSTAIFANEHPGEAFPNTEVTIKASQAGGVNSTNNTDWFAAGDVSQIFNLSDLDSDGDGVPDSRQYLCQNFSASASSTPNMVWNGADGEATATASGGSGSYTYLWNSGETTQAINGLGPNTTHTVTITDSNGCTGIASTTVTEGASDPCSNFSASASSTPNMVWNGADGEATATASGGSGSYTYSWSSGQTSQAITGLGPNTTHTVTVTDSVHNCTASDSTTVGDSSQHPCFGVFTVAYTNTSPSSGQSDGSIYTQIFGTSTPPLSVTLKDATTQAVVYQNSNLTVKEFTASNLPAGDYKLSMTEVSSGCNFVNAQGVLIGDVTLYP